MGVIGLMNVRTYVAQPHRKTQTQTDGAGVPHTLSVKLSGRIHPDLKLTKFGKRKTYPTLPYPTLPYPTHHPPCRCHGNLTRKEPLAVVFRIGGNCCRVIPIPATGMGINWNTWN